MGSMKSEIDVTSLTSFFSKRLFVPRNFKISKIFKDFGFFSSVLIQDGQNFPFQIFETQFTEAFLSLNLKS